MPVALDQEAAVQYVLEHVPPDQAIFVGNVHHDRIFLNDIVFYFLAERRSATQYHHLHPGLATTEPVQRDIINSLEAGPVDLVVLYSGAEGVNEPNLSSVSSGVHILDQFIRANYVPTVTFGQYQIYERRGGA